ncbi:hypothetical protein NEOKW01_2140, partial [Nematocida sp. AWRm80]
MSSVTSRKVKQTKKDINNVNTRFNKITPDSSHTDVKIVFDICNTTLNEAESLLESWDSLVENEADPALKTTRQADIDKEYDDPKGLPTLISDLKIMLITLRTYYEAETTHQPTNGGDSSLPVLKIPKFSGGLREYGPFIQAFKTNVHEKNISDGKKLAYLMQYLEGEAAAAIKGFAIVDENYTAVLQTLKDRFVDPQGLSRSLMDEFYKLPTAPDYYPKLRSTTDQMTTILRQLSSAHVDIENLLVYDLIESKMPCSMRRDLIIAREKDVNWSVEKSIALINREMLLRKRLHCEATPTPATFTSIKRQHQPQPQHPPQVARQARPTTPTDGPATFPNNVPLPKKTPTTPCILCCENHWTNECQKYSTIEERKRRFVELRRCEDCGRVHAANECRALIAQCKYCKNVGHVSVLCPRNNQVVAAFNQDVSVKPNKAKTCMLVRQCTAINPVTNMTTELVALLDTGSNQTIITEAATARLKLTRQNEHDTTVIGVGNRKSREPSADVNFHIKTSDGVLDTWAITKNTLTPPLRLIDLPEDLNEETRLTSLNISEQPIDLIIGTDYLFDLITGTRQINNEIKITETKVGPIYCGKSFPGTTTTHITATCISFDENLATTKFDLGDSSSECDEDEQVTREFNNTVSKPGKHYEVRLNFRPTKAPLKSNMGLAYGRLQSLYKKLEAKPQTLIEYDAEFKKMEAAGTIEEAPKKPSNLIHYMPHQAVIKPDSATTKVRPVFDASAKINQNETSLNDALYKGPKMLPDLAGILLRLRCHKFIACGDIQKAFHQIHVHPDDRDVLRFLWLRDISKPPTKDNVSHFRFRGVPFGLNLSPFLLNATVRHHLQIFGPEKDQIAENTYVDNIGIGADNETDVIDLRQRLQHHFDTAGMLVREWQSNSKAIIDSIVPELTQNPNNAKILGLSWNAETDELKINFTSNDNANLNTKRKVLQTIASVYDPLGILSPCTIAARIFMQSLWQENLEWDDPLPDKLTKKFHEITADWSSAQINLSRNTIAVADIKGLHVFCDASQEAVCAAVYSVSDTSSHLIMAKTRVKPKRTTIPKMELN